MTTTTDAATQEPGAENAQPVEQPAEAVITPSEPITTNESENTPTDKTEPVETDNSEESKEASEEWLKSKGLDPNDPEAFKKAANMAFNSEKLMTQTQQRTSELEKNLTAAPYNTVSDNEDIQAALEATANMQLEIQVERWKNAHNITPEQDASIGQYLQQNETKAYLLKNGYITLDDVASMSGALKPDTNALKDEGGKQALERLASKQRATSVTAGASTNATPPEEDPILAILKSD